LQGLGVMPRSDSELQKIARKTAKVMEILKFTKAATWTLFFWISLITCCQMAKSPSRTRCYAKL
jgi:hypothetical protein